MMYQHPDGVRQATNFFDWATQTWVGDTDGYDTTGLIRGGYGNMAVNYSASFGYQYHFFVTFYTYNCQASVQWPDTPFIPTNPSPTYTVLDGEDYQQIWPYIGLTRSHLHQIFTDYDGHISGVQYAIIYDRSADLASWDGMVPIVNTPDGPWYGFYSDPFSNRVVLTYCRTSSDNHIIMLVDTMSGNMFYAGVPLQVDVSQVVLNQTGTTYYVGFVGDGNPFVDKDGNVHLITFGSDGQNVAPVEIYHFFWDLTADTINLTHYSQYRLD